MQSTEDRRLTNEIQSSFQQEVEAPFLIKKKFDSESLHFLVKDLLEKKFALSRARMVLVIILIFLNMTYNENAESYDFDSNLSLVLLDTISVITILYVLCKAFSIFLKTRLLRAEKLIPFSKNLTWKNFAYISVFLVHPNRFAEGIYIESYASFPIKRFERKLNEYFLAFQITVLVYDVFKRLLFINTLYDEQVSLKIRKNHVRHSILFYVKYVFLKNPVNFIVKLIVIGSLYFSYLLKVFESPIDIRDMSNLIFWSNAIWTTFVTALTIGYGDCYPRTHFGRIISISTGIYGFIVFTLLTIAIVAVKDFNIREKKLFNSIDLDILRKNMKLSAEKTIKMAILCYRDWNLKNVKGYETRRLKLEHEMINFKNSRLAFEKHITTNSAAVFLYPLHRTQNKKAQ